jgi:hypothetical protein
MAKTTNKMKRWWQFGVRDLFLVMVVVALIVGWWMDHRRMARDMLINRLDAEVARAEAKRYEKAVARKEAQIELLVERLEQVVSDAQNQGSNQGAISEEPQ